MSGFGAYPQPFRSRPGGGPRDVVALDRPIAQEQFDFETIHTIDAQTTESCFTVREAMRSYHMCHQYWLATCIYQRFPNKRLRTFVTLAVSAFWQGSYSGYFISMLGIPLYLPVESLWQGLLQTKSNGVKKKIIDGFFWFSKTFVTSWLGMAFLLMSTEKIIYYYGSVYYLGYAYGVGLYLTGLLVQVQRTSAAKDRKPKAPTPALPAAASAPKQKTPTPAPQPVAPRTPTPPPPAPAEPEPEPEPEPPAPTPTEPEPVPEVEPPPPPPPAPEPEPEPEQPAPQEQLQTEPEPEVQAEPAPVVQEEELQPVSTLPDGEKEKQE